MLEVRDVTVHAGSRVLLAGVGFAAEPGEIVGVIGPNGAGKTTLLEVLVGLRRASSAVVTFRGVSLKSFRDRARTFAFLPDTSELAAELDLADGGGRGASADPQPVALDVFLDRDDSRRRQLETDVIAKLYLARPDLVVRTPLDERENVAEAERDDDYGRIIVHVGSSSRETRSTSRREIVTLTFEAAGLPLPDWSMAPYAGFPFVAEGVRRTVLAVFAYLVVPLGLLTTGALLTRRRSVR